MNLTVATYDRIIQLSDTRITDGNFVVRDDDLEVKPTNVCIGACKLLITYCGLAEIDGSTSKTIAEIARKSHTAPNVSMFLNALRIQFGAAFGRHVLRHNVPIARWRTSISFAGFTPSHAVFAGRITNHELKDDSWAAQASQQFELQGKMWSTFSHSMKTREAYMEVNGIDPKHARHLLDTKLRRLRRSKTFHQTSNAFCARQLAEIIRSYAEEDERRAIASGRVSPISQHTVGATLPFDGPICLQFFDSTGSVKATAQRLVMFGHVVTTEKTPDGVTWRMS